MMRARLEFDDEEESDFTAVEFVAEVATLSQVSLMIEEKLLPTIGVDWGCLIAFMMNDEMENGCQGRVLRAMSTQCIEGWIFHLQKELQDRKS